MIATARRRGNSLTLRLRKEELELAGISDGDLVKVEIIKVLTAQATDLAGLPTFEDADPSASVQHDKYLSQ